MRLRYQVDNLNVDRESDNVTVDAIEAEDAAGNLRVDPAGNLAVSAIDESKRTHLPIFDLDVPHRLVPSRTPGHSHLYVDVEVPADKLRAVIAAMVDAGLMGPGNLAQFDVRGMQCARVAELEAGR